MAESSYKYSRAAKFQGHGAVSFTLALAVAVALYLICPRVPLGAADELVAPESKSVKRGGLQFLKHAVPVKFNARIGAYYYWRVKFSDLATPEFYTRDTTYHQFTLDAPAPGGSNYKAVLQRKLYAWESWKNYYEDPTPYAVDAYEPMINTMEPSNGIVTGDPAPNFRWRAYDEGTGLHEKPYMFMIVTASRQPVYNSGWTADETYKPAAPMKPGTYMWGLHARDNDGNIAMSQFHSFSINSSEPPKVLRFEVAGIGARTDYTSTENLMAAIEATDNIGVTHYYLSDVSNPPEADGPQWVPVGSPSTLFSATVPFRIAFKQDHLTAANGYSYSHKIHLWVKDYENNVSEQKTIGLIVDPVKPRDASIRINNGAFYTLNREVKLRLWAVDNVGAVGYLIRESAGVPAAPRIDDPAWVMNRSFEILKFHDFDHTLSDTLGSKTLFVWYRDDAGNISDAASATIQYDTSPPVSPITGSLGLKGETIDGAVDTRDVVLILNASGSYNNQITSYFIREGGPAAAPAPESSGWRAFTAPDARVSGEVALRLSAGDGTKEVYAWYKDNYDNISPAYKCEMMFDVQAPEASLKITGSGEWHRSSLVEVDVEGSDGIGVAAFLASIYCHSAEELKASPGLWNYVQPQKRFSMKTTVDAGSVNGERQIFAWLKDAAGNVSRTAKVSFKLDTLPPVIGARTYSITKVAGSKVGYAEGPADTAQFNFINSLHVNSRGEIYVADQNNYRIRKIKDGMVSTFAGTGMTDRSGPRKEYAIAVPLSAFEDYYGNVLIGDAHLMKIASNDGSLIVRFAGNDFRNMFNPYFHGGDDARVDQWPYSRAEFNKVSGLAADGFGNIYTADVKYVRRLRNGIVYVAVGNPYGTSADGPAENIRIINAGDLTVDAAGTVYFADGGAHDIRKLTTDGIVTTLAGRNGSPGFADGPRGTGLLNTPTSITMDKYGTTYIADFTNRAIRILTPDGYLSTVTPPADGLQVMMPQGIGLMPDGSIVFGEQNAAQVKRLAIGYSRGLKTLPAGGSSDGFVRLQLIAADNYSGIAACYLSNDPSPPSAVSAGWRELDYKGGQQTFEVLFAPADPRAQQTVYVWLKDRAGNVSNHESVKLNEKTMAVAEIIGAGGALRSPSAVACDRYGNVYVADSDAAPIKKFTAGGSSSKHGVTGAARDALGPLRSLTVFGDGRVGALEGTRARFSFLDDNFEVSGYIAHEIDLNLNVHDAQAQSTGGTLSKLTDKYCADGRDEDFGIDYGHRFDGVYPPDFFFAPRRMEVYADAGYSKKIDGPLSSFRHPTVYLKVYGSGGDGGTINSIIAGVRATEDYRGTSIQLIETGEATNIFTGSFNIGQYRSYRDPVVGARLDNRIFVTFYTRAGEKTFPLDVTGQWVPVGENQPSPSSATYISMKIHNGIIYVAYSDEQQGDKVSVVKCENGRWSFLGNPGISAGPAREIILEIYDSKPCVLYSDQSVEFKATAMIFRNGKWEPLGERDFSEPHASYLTMCVAGSNIFMAYTSQLAEKAPAVMKYDPFTGWKPFTTFGLTDRWVDYNCLASDGGALYFLTRDQKKAGFLFYKHDGEKWIALTDEPMKEKCELLGLKINNGEPYIMYSKSYGGLLYITKYKNGEWLQVGKTPISEGRNLFSNFAFAGSTPYAVFTDGACANRVVVMKFDGEEWKSVGEKGISQSMAGYTCIDCWDGEPYIAFRDTVAGERMKVLKYEY